MLIIARSLRVFCAIVAIGSVALIAFCAWRAVSDHLMQVREGWRFRCGTVHAAVVVGMGGAAAGVAALLWYRESTAWERKLRLPPKA